MRYNMRRSDKEITDPETLKKILKTAPYVTIAMSMEGKPYLVSLSHGYDESRNCVYFHCAKKGKKLDYLRSNDVVWGQAVLDHGYFRAEDPCEYNHLFASVHFSGKVTFIDDPDEKRHALECLIRQLNGEPEPSITRLSPDRIAGVQIGRIDIDFMTGKKSKEVTV
jgi:nitroimidazol reductase NimA-like FMN-containing flavoprotein (pyridoxamine 5'-phosphate oxidase superfamily)